MDLSRSEKVGENQRVPPKSGEIQRETQEIREYLAKSTRNPRKPRSRVSTTSNFNLEDLEISRNSRKHWSLGIPRLAIFLIDRLGPRIQQLKIEKVSKFSKTLAKSINKRVKSCLIEYISGPIWIVLERSSILKQ